MAAKVDTDKVLQNPTGEDSLSADFGERVGVEITGHPNEVGDPRGAADEGEGGGTGGEEGKGSGEEETAEQKVAREAAEAAAKGPEGETKEQKAARLAADAEAAKKPALKYKSQEEAERAEAEATTRMHTATTEAATVKQENEALKAQLAEAEAAKIKESEVKPLTPEEFRAKLVAVSKVANIKAMGEIGKLDMPDKFDAEAVAAYNAKVAEIRANADAEAHVEAQTIRDQQDAARQAAEAAKQVEIAKKAAKEAATSPEPTQVSEPWKAALEHGRKAGLAIDDPTKPDLYLFEAAERNLPENLRGKGATPEVLKWMEDWTKERLPVTVDPQAEQEAREKAALEKQKEQRVLGRGGNVTPSKQPKEESGSLESDFEEARRDRILT